MGRVKYNEKERIHKRKYSQPSQGTTKHFSFDLDLPLLLKVTVIHSSSDAQTTQI